MADNSQKFTIEEMDRGRAYIEESQPKFASNRTQFEQTTMDLLTTWRSPAAQAYKGASDDFCAQMKRTEDDLEELKQRLIQTINQLRGNVEETQQQASSIASMLNAM